VAGNLATLKAALAQAETNLLNALTNAGAPGNLPNAKGAGDFDDGEYVERQLKIIERLKVQISLADGPWELETRSP
jgi:hypothetical protein